MPLYTSPFPRLDLSLEDKEQLMQTADELFDTIRLRFERFLWQENSRVDPNIFEIVRENEDVRVYHDLRPGAGTGKKNMHLLLSHGTILGTLHDAMYGVFNHSTNDMRIKTAYVKNTILDSAVLENILEPTVDQPFQSLTVRWFVKGVPTLARTVAKHRDNVFLEATGIKMLSNGEPAGFHLMHSIKFDKTPPLPQYQRFNFSICTVWRQKTPDRAEAYMTSYVEIAETIGIGMLIKSHADPLAAMGNYAHSAQMKKLAWLVRQKNTIAQLQDRNINDGCSVCGSQSRSTRQGIKSECAACCKYTCKRCRVKRELSLFAPDGQLIKHEMRFCISCLTTANLMDSGVVAAHEVAEKDGQQRHRVKTVLSTAMGRNTVGASPSTSVVSSSSSSSIHDTSGQAWKSSSSSASSLSLANLQISRTNSTHSDASSDAEEGVLI